jgi:hypothetical protein
MGFGTQLPSGEAAFGHGQTRKVWAAARRRVRWRFALWSLLCLGGFAVGCVVTAYEGPAAPEGGLGGGIGAVSLLTYVCVLYACLGALRRLRQARGVLKACPWQPVAAVRRLTGTSESKGVPVQFRWSPESEGGEWTRSVVARNPLRWNRWDDAMQQGAWFAGGAGPMAVLALPGGRGLMTVQMRTRAVVSGRAGSAAVKESA